MLAEAGSVRPNLDIPNLVMCSLLKSSQAGKSIQPFRTSLICSVMVCHTVVPSEIA
jgi:hypothetical protein